MRQALHDFGEKAAANTGGMFQGDELGLGTRGQGGKVNHDADSIVGRAIDLHSPKMDLSRPVVGTMNHPHEAGCSIKGPFALWVESHQRGYSEVTIGAPEMDAPWNPRKERFLIPFEIANPRISPQAVKATVPKRQECSQTSYWWALRTFSRTAGSASGVAPGRAANHAPMRLAASFMAERGAPRKKW